MSCSDLVGYKGISKLSQEYLKYPKGGVEHGKAQSLYPEAVSNGWEYSKRAARKVNLPAYCILPLSARDLEVYT